MSKVIRRIVLFLFPGKSESVRRKIIRQTIAGVIIGLLLALAFGLLLYFLNTQGRL